MPRIIRTTSSACQNVVPAAIKNPPINTEPRIRDKYGTGRTNRRIVGAQEGRFQHREVVGSPIPDDQDAQHGHAADRHVGYVLAFDGHAAVGCHQADNIDQKEPEPHREAQLGGQEKGNGNDAKEDGRAIHAPGRWSVLVLGPMEGLAGFVEDPFQFQVDRPHVGLVVIEGLPGQQDHHHANTNPEQLVAEQVGQAVAELLLLHQGQSYLGNRIGESLVLDPLFPDQAGHGDHRDERTNQEGEPVP